MHIKKILIANRGEIALRILKTCQEMGIDAVTIYTEKEKGLPHVVKAQESYSLGEGELSETYLNTKKIIGIAKLANAQAIHPGYGLLSENDQFVQEVIDNNLIFIGPSPDNIKLMGDKRQAKVSLEKLNIPLIPGHHGQEQDPQLLQSKSKQIGYPLLIKASAGGGGKGMRIVHKESDFLEALSMAKSEAKKAFGNEQVILEKWIENPRHIEVQVLSDTHDNHFHLFERECSIQRRYQKIIEESPSPKLSAITKNKMLKTATDITRGINYKGAGTIEFIVDDQENYYFLEMNTRLQVEHPITEMTTGIDIVRAQIEVAQGLPLNWKQEQIEQRGHAIEVRLYAEDPGNDFFPSIGKIEQLTLPLRPNIRCDFGIEQGNEVTIHFDPMIGKLIAWSKDRTSCIQKITSALEELVLVGFTTNRRYLISILNHPKFQEGLTFTHFIPQHHEELRSNNHLTDDELAEGLAAYLLGKFNSLGPTQSADENFGENQQTSAVWQNLRDFRNS